MAELAAITYSEALFEVGLETESIDSLLSEYTFLIDTFESNLSFFELFKSPQVNKIEKKEILVKVFAENVSSEMMNFLKILIDKSRTTDLEKIYRAYVERVDIYKKETTAFVKTVVPMTEQQHLELTTQLQQLTGKKVTISNIIEPDIVGGMMIKMGDQVLDGSIKRKLMDLKESLGQLRL